MASADDKAALIQRAEGLAEELADAVQRADWDQVYLIAQALQEAADQLSSGSP